MKTSWHGLGICLVAGSLGASLVQGPLFNPRNQHFYYLLDAPSWTVARDEAMASNWTLVTIRSQQEQNFLTDHFQTDQTGNGNQYLWTGLYCTTNGSYAWQSGEAVTYTNWAAGEPNNFSRGTSYVALNYTGSAERGKWADWTNPPSGTGVLKTRYLAEQRAPAWPDFSWVQNVGGSLGSSRMGLAVDGKGDILFCTRFGGTVLYGTSNFTSVGSSDIGIGKLDPSGKLLWVRPAGGVEFDSGEGVAGDAQGNVYATGSFRTNAAFGETNLLSAGVSDIFLAKYDADGNLRWVHSAGGPGTDLGQEVRMDAAGNIYLAGSFQGTAVFGPTNLVATGGADIFLAKYDAEGQLLWARRAGGAADDFAYRLVLNAAGEVYVAGIFSSSPADFNQVVLTNFGARDMYLAKYSADGEVRWVQHPGSAVDDFANALALDRAGNVLLGGFYKGSAVFGTNTLPFIANSLWAGFLAKYDAEGNPLWAKLTGRGPGWPFTGNVFMNSLAVDAFDNIYGVATFRVDSIFDGVILANADVVGGSVTHAAMLKYAPDGHLRWAQQSYPGNTFDDGLMVAADAAGNAYFGGMMNGRNYVFGTGTFTNVASASTFMFVAKIPADLPQLRLVTDAGEAALSWTNAPAGFVLESAAECTAGAFWQPVAQPFSTNQETVSVRCPLTEQSQFFRLRRP